MTLPEITASFTATIQSYIQALDRYNDALFASQPSEAEWSLAQIYEHIYTANTYFFLANVKRCLEKREGQSGGEMTPAGLNVFSHNSLPSVKLKMPENVDKNNSRQADPVGRDRELYKELYAQTITDEKNLAEALAADDGAYKTRHFMFGWLNAAEWLQATEQHARHHFRQQQEREEWLGIKR